MYIVSSYIGIEDYGRQAHYPNKRAAMKDAAQRAREQRGVTGAARVLVGCYGPRIKQHWVAEWMGGKRVTPGWYGSPEQHAAQIGQKIAK